MGRNKCYRSVWELVDKRADDDCWPWTWILDLLKGRSWADVKEAAA